MTRNLPWRIHLPHVIAVHFNPFGPPAPMRRQPELTAIPALTRLNVLLVFPGQPQAHRITLAAIGEEIRPLGCAPIPLKYAQSTVEPSVIQPAESVISIITTCWILLPPQPG